jgi:hypothetical protein
MAQRRPLLMAALFLMTETTTIPNGREPARRPGALPPVAQSAFSPQTPVIRR